MDARNDNNDGGESPMAIDYLRAGTGWTVTGGSSPLHSAASSGSGRRTRDQRMASRCTPNGSSVARTTRYATSADTDQAAVTFRSSAAQAG